MLENLGKVACGVAGIDDEYHGMKLKIHLQHAVKLARAAVLQRTISWRTITYSGPFNGAPLHTVDHLMVHPWYPTYRVRHPSFARGHVVSQVSTRSTTA